MYVHASACLNITSSKCVYKLTGIRTHASHTKTQPSRHAYNTYIHTLYAYRLRRHDLLAMPIMEPCRAISPWWYAAVSSTAPANWTTLTGSLNLRLNAVYRTCKRHDYIYIIYMYVYIYIYISCTRHEYIYIYIYHACTLQSGEDMPRLFCVQRARGVVAWIRHVVNLRRLSLCKHLYTRKCHDCVHVRGCGACLALRRLETIHDVWNRAVNRVVRKVDIFPACPRGESSWDSTKGRVQAHTY